MYVTEADDQPDTQDAGDVTEGFAVGVNFSF